MSHVELVAAAYLTVLLLTLPRLIAATPHPCKDLINQSLTKDYDWTSLTALSLAQCLQSKRLPTPPTSSCIFYTASSKDQAIAYGSASNRTTIYDVYDPADFDQTVWPANEWFTTDHLRDLFRITSKSYAMSCSGEAHLVLPTEVKDEDVCRESIWVTDEYEAIRSGDSGIVLPIWRVSWREMEDGVWGWIKQQLRAVGLGSIQGRGMPSHAGQEDVIAADSNLVARTEQKILDVKKQWSWEVLEDGWGDLWAVDGGKCGR
jgi:hypothetical protein